MIGCWSSLPLAALCGRRLLGQGLGLGCHLVRLSIGCVVGRNRRLGLGFMTAGQPASLAGVEPGSLLSSCRTDEGDGRVEVLASWAPRRPRQITGLPSQPRPRESTGQHFSSAWCVASLMRRCAGPLPPGLVCAVLVAPPPPSLCLPVVNSPNIVLRILNCPPRQPF